MTETQVVFDMRSLIRWKTRALVLGSLAFFSSLASALPLISYSDYEISRLPIVVIGYWPRAAYNDNSLIRNEGTTMGRPSDHQGGLTSLVVTQSVVGGVSVGTHQLELDGVGWEHDLAKVSGPWPYGSLGAVCDLTKPCIWFLKLSLTAEPSGRPRLRLTCFQGVQNLSFIDYYLALKRDAREALHLALNSKDPLLVRRGIYLASGWSVPWPAKSLVTGAIIPPPGPQLDALVREFDEMEAIGVGSRSETETESPIPNAIEELRGVMHRATGELRALAVAAFANLAGEWGIGSLRHLLDDAQAEVRSIAAIYLILLDDPASFASIQRAFLDPKQPLDHNVVAMAIWKSHDRAFAPILVSYLGETFPASAHGTSLPTPAALAAKRALHEFTGTWYPLGARTRPGSLPASQTSQRSAGASSMR